MIPRSIDDWLLCIARSDSLYACDCVGNSLDGFPLEFSFIDPNQDPSIYLCAGDLNGDEIPELLVKPSSTDYFFAYDLEGNEVHGFPIITSETFFSESISIVRDEQDDAMVFSTEQLQQQYGARLVGYRGGDIMPGFPAEIDTVNAQFVATSNAVLHGNDTLHILHNNMSGHVMMWDLPLEGSEIRLEWPMPANTPCGMRMYIPEGEIGMDGKSWEPRPETYSIGAIYPNPGNGGFSIPFKAVRNGSVRLSVYSLTGSLVWTDTIYAVAYQQVHAFWPGTNTKGEVVSSGVYLVKLEGTVNGIRKAVFIR